MSEEFIVRLILGAIALSCMYWLTLLLQRLAFRAEQHKPAQANIKTGKGVAGQMPANFLEILKDVKP